MFDEMGVYLARPKTEKFSSDGENSKLAFGASSMQGWRESQEDAHNAVLNYGDESTAFFAVYDGHGGHEVAEYCAEKLPDFIKKLDSYQKGDIEEALIQGFLEFDATVATPEVINILKEMVSKREREERLADDNYEYDIEDDDDENGENVSHLFKEAEMPIEKVMEKYKNLFGRSMKAGKKILNSPVIRNKQNDKINSDACCSSSSSNLSKEKTEVVEEKKEVVEEKTEVGGEEKDENNIIMTLATEKTDDTQNRDEKNSVENLKVDANGVIDSKVETTTEENLAKKPQDKETEDSKSTVIQNGDETVEKETDENKTSSPDEKSPTNKGKGKAPKIKKSPSIRPIRKSAELYNKLLEDFKKENRDDDDTLDEESEDEEDKTFIGPEVSDNSSDDDVNTSIEEAEEESSEEIDDDLSTDDDDEDLEKDGVPIFPRTVKEDPGLDSGCTAVVALLKDNQLYVANAGDSRCVVCRNGKAIDMSFDHKPEDQIEKLRIEMAGGSVSHDGRVNGGLNLSRAIGDHTYKQNKDLNNKEQMITALPDVKRLKINPLEDEFMILACDGIWNFMSSQAVVDFIKPKLELEEKLSKICEDIFDKCLAPDTTGDGTGCDNMTAIIVKFKNSGTNRKRPIASEQPEEEISDQVDENAVKCKRIKIEEKSAKHVTVSAVADVGDSLLSTASSSS